MSTQNSLDGYYPHIETITDSFGNTFVSNDGINAGGVTVKHNPVVHPGDVVTFTCIGADAAGRQLEFSLHSGAGSASTQQVATGETATLQWTVQKGDVMLHKAVTINMKAVDAEYHRHGDNDQSARFKYQVNPPNVN